jgi:hypothetical protein
VSTLPQSNRGKSKKCLGTNHQGVGQFLLTTLLAEFQPRLKTAFGLYVFLERLFRNHGNRASTDTMQTTKTNCEATDNNAMDTEATH